MSILSNKRRSDSRPPVFSWQPERPVPEPGIERPFPENSYYLLPRSAAEVGRLDFQHYLLRSVLHSDYAAPLLEETHEILDVGCGTGLWCRAMTCQFPCAFLTGVDLLPPERRPDDSPRC